MGQSELIADTIDNLRQVFRIIQEYSKKVEHTTGFDQPPALGHEIPGRICSDDGFRIGRRMYLHPATVVGVLVALESHGLIKRTRSKEDRRVVWVELTLKGKNLVAAAPEVAQGLLVMGLEKTQLNGLREVNKGLKRLVSILALRALSLILFCLGSKPPSQARKRAKQTKIAPFRQGDPNKK